MGFAHKSLSVRFQVNSGNAQTKRIAVVVAPENEAAKKAQIAQKSNVSSGARLCAKHQPQRTNRLHALNIFFASVLVPTTAAGRSTQPRPN
jgi:hypothetical protein